MRSKPLLFRLILWVAHIVSLYLFLSSSEKQCASKQIIRKQTINDVVWVSQAKQEGMVKIIQVVLKTDQSAISYTLP